MGKTKEVKYTYTEVKKVLCDGCKLGLASSMRILSDKTIHYHEINGVEVPCTAVDWIKRSRCGEHRP